LTSSDAQPAGKGKISWNFEKFLIGRDGRVKARYKSGTSPNDKTLVAKIDSLIKESKP
jgi:glutathione peroxidase